MNSFVRFVDRQSQFRLTVLCLLMFLTLCVFDYFRDANISLSIFYLLPIGMATWFVGRRTAVLMSSLGALIWAAAEFLEIAPHSSYAFLFRNPAVRVGFLLSVVFLLASIRSWGEELEKKVEERTALLAKEIEERKSSEAERERLIGELREALSRVTKLRGLLPICASCKRIRDDQGYWNQIEEYLHQHSDAEFTHGICPECVDKLYPEFRAG